MRLSMRLGGGAGAGAAAVWEISIRVAPPSRSSESLLRVAHPRRSSESLIRVAGAGAAAVWGDPQLLQPRLLLPGPAPAPRIRVRHSRLLLASESGTAVCSMQARRLQFRHPSQDQSYVSTRASSPSSVRSPPAGSSPPRSLQGHHPSVRVSSVLRPRLPLQPPRLPPMSPSSGRLAPQSARRLGPEAGRMVTCGPEELCSRPPGWTREALRLLSEAVRALTV